MERRRFIRNSAIAAGGLALGPSGWRALSAGPAGAASAPSRCLVQATGLPYGRLRTPDANGIRLPAGFRSRVIATTGQPVRRTGYPWHFAPDGGACFAVPGTTGEYVYVSNSEVPVAGGASAIRFGPDGSVRDAYRILTDTSVNCAGGPTPWGTWLSGEEFEGGQIWECNPFAESQGIPRPALGFYAHEAAAVDPVHRQLYLTEDRPSGRLYRFTPAHYPDLGSGRLEVARLRVGGRVVATATDVWEAQVEWVTVSDGAVGAVQPRPAHTTAFDGGEGIWWERGKVYFTTKGDNRVWRLGTTTQRLCVLYDDDAVANAPLHGVDNVVVSRGGEVLVAEDGGDLQINVIRDNRVGPLLKVTGQPSSEITGPAFSPAGDRLYFSSQRALGGQAGTGVGITYEVKGPFLGARV